MGVTGRSVGWGVDVIVGEGVLVGVAGEAVGEEVQVGPGVGV